jgi:hypothetical protein
VAGTGLKCGREAVASMLGKGHKGVIFDSRDLSCNACAMVSGIGLSVCRHLPGIQTLNIADSMMSGALLTLPSSQTMPSVSDINHYQSATVLEQLLSVHISIMKRLRSVVRSGLRTGF